MCALLRLSGSVNYLSRLCILQASTSGIPFTSHRETTGNLDVSELLPKVPVPTLVMHKREDQVQPFEAGRELAVGIPGSQFVALQGQKPLPVGARSRNGAHARRDQAVLEKVISILFHRKKCLQNQPPQSPHIAPGARHCRRGNSKTLADDRLWHDSDEPIIAGYVRSLGDCVAKRFCASECA
jgi:hypothetical protein